MSASMQFEGRGIIAKLKRADGEIQNLESCFKDLFNKKENGYRSIHTHVGNRLIIRAFGNPEVPDEYLVRSGEVIHHFRSCLDYLVCSLVSAYGTVTKEHMFPVCATELGWEKSHRKKLAGLPPPVVAKIRDLQPFHQSNPEQSTLYVINDLDNADKHRLLPLSVAACRVGEELVFDHDGSAGVEICAFGDPSMVQVKADGVDVFWVEFLQPSPHATLNVDIKWEVLMQHSGATFGRALLPILRHMSKYTQRTIGQVLASALSVPPR